MRSRAWLVEHTPFAVAAALGLVARILLHVAFTPAFIHSDGPTYLSIIATLEPDPDRPIGYVLLLLYPLSLLTADALAVALVQHLLGLATAVVLYALMRRWRIGRWTAMLVTLPVLFDTLQLNLEHSVLSDTLFDFLLVCGVAVLCWRRQVMVSSALGAGLILGTSATVRVVGEPLIVAGAVFCLLIGLDWRRRLVTAAALALGFALPVAAYASWYHQERGTYALSEFSGKALYLRSTSFVDCPQLSVPDYQQVLCPDEALGERRDPTYYLFHDPNTLPELHPPPGTTQDEALSEFAFAAMREQPLDYAATAARDFMLNFDWWRGDRYEYSTAHKWTFASYIDVQPTDWTGPAYESHGGEQLQARQPLARWFAAYESVGYLPGPLLLGCLVVGLLNVLGVGRARSSGTRSVTALLLMVGLGLLLVPDLTAEFTWRYQLPALAVLPAAAALGYTGWRGGLVDAGTEATANTD